jgi:4-alpha-glucanotransferase
MLLTPEKPLAGILAPLFALRTTEDLGIGDVGALREFIDWAAENGFRLVQLLPINETGKDHSPYNAISSVALDPATIEITPKAIPDLSAEEIAEITAGVDLQELRASAVQYEVVKPLKLRLLARAFENFWKGDRRKPKSARARSFREFCRDEATWLDDFALFRVLMDENGGSECWDQWLDGQRSAAAAREWLAAQKEKVRRPLARRMIEVQYRQWIAWQQWRDLKAHADKRKVALMGDVPFGVSYDSADTWGLSGIFDLAWSGGCPPERILEVDEFTRKWGQNWGIPLYRWDILRNTKYQWWRQRVHKVRAVFHLFRIDHILGLFRIYAFPWPPALNAEFLPLTEEEASARADGELPHFSPHADDTPEHCQANAAQGEEILQALLEECGEYRLIGEDLGEVPPYVRPALQRLHIAGFKIPQWENEPNGRMTPGEKYERLSLVTYATHDHEPLRSMWEGWMKTIAAAEAGGPAEPRDQAWREARRFADYAGFDLPSLAPWSDEIHERLLDAILRSNSWLCVLMITDLFGSTQRFNVPGAVAASNWSERLPGTADDWRRDPVLSKKVERISALAQASGR